MNPRPARPFPRRGLLPCAALLAASLLLGAAPASAQNPAPPPTDDDARYRSALLFSSILELIREEYVDAQRVDYEKLTYAALDGMLTSLDPFSEFLDAERYAAIKRDTEGEFTGIGIHIGVRGNNTLTVDMPVEGGPAARAGLLPGDWIVKIDGTSTKGLTLGQAVRSLRGKVGEPVTLTIYRPSAQETRDLTIIREVIDVPTIRGTRILAEYARGPRRPAYLRIVQFGEKTPAEFDQALRKLTAEGMDGLILDLRNNPGGVLDASVEVAGRFVAPGTVIVSTEGRRGASDRAFFESRARTTLPDLPLVILVNRHSASAAEIVAGALKDLGRAVLVGETTYGKGSVQTIQPLDPLHTPPIGVRLTTAKYYTPAHLPIHGVGIQPHIPVHVSLQEEQNILKRQNWHQLTREEQEKVQSMPDAQLARAVAVLQALQVYAERKQGR
jgi:carboxyl-terminal processing protease